MWLNKKKLVGVTVMFLKCQLLVKDSRRHYVFAVISVLVLTIFFISRSLSFFPVPSLLLAFTALILISLSYLNYFILQINQAHLFSLTLVLFTLFKYYIAVLLIYFWGDEPFNDYSMVGYAVPVLWGFELIYFFSTLYFIPELRRSKLKFSTSISMALVSCLAFILVVLLALLTQPRRLELRYAGYEPSLAQQIQIWYVDYGGSSGINCNYFTVERIGVFIRRSPISNTEIKQITRAAQESCRLIA